MQPFTLRWLIPFTLVVMLLAACGDTADDSADTTLAATTTTVSETTSTTAPPTTLAETTTTTVPATTTIEVGDPCDPSNPHPPGLKEYSITSGGIERTYFVHVPEDYTADTNWPVIVGLHGIAGSTR